MKLNLAFEDKGQYLLVTCTGEWMFRYYKQAVALLHEELRRTGHTRVLVDGGRVDAWPSMMERYWLGLYSAVLFRGKIKVAMINRRQIINRFAETTARNRGLNAYVTDNYEDAEHWLLSEE